LDADPNRNPNPDPDPDPDLDPDSGPDTDLDPGPDPNLNPDPDPDPNPSFAIPILHYGVIFDPTGRGRVKGDFKTDRYSHRHIIRPLYDDLFSLFFVCYVSLKVSN